MIVAICEDNERQAQRLQEMAVKYGETHRLPLQIFVYASAEELLEQFGTVVYDAAVLDIYLKGMSGLEAARRLTIRNPRCRVILATVSRAYALEAYGIGAVHYLVKPIKYRDFEVAMERCCREREQIMEKDAAAPVLEICMDRNRFLVRQEVVTYIEIWEKRSTVHTKYFDYITWMPLKELYGHLDPGIFLQVQRSYIVNMGYIARLSGGRCVLKNGLDIAVSRLNRNAVKARYEHFIFQEARCRQ